MPAALRCLVIDLTPIGPELPRQAEDQPHGLGLNRVDLQNERPDLITIAGIDWQTNVQVRRVMIERYRHGEEIHAAAAVIRGGGGERLDHDARYGTLWRRNILRPVIREGDRSDVPDDEPIVMIEVVNRTRELDGRFKRYWLGVPPEMRTAREAVAWTFNMRAEQYAPEIET